MAFKASNYSDHSSYFATAQSDEYFMCHVINDEYTASLNDFESTFTCQDILEKGIKYTTELFGGLWASRLWNMPGFNFNDVGIKFAHTGSAPIPELGNGGLWPSNIRVSGGTEANGLICVTYYNNKLWYSIRSSTTVPTSEDDWTAALASDHCNVVIVMLLGAGGGGGGGTANNPAIGYSYCGGGGGGGGGGYSSFIYRFDPDSTFDNKTVLCLTAGKSGQGGSGVTGSDARGNDGTQGGTSTCRIDSFTSTPICRATGGYGGSGGAQTYNVSGGAGGLGGAATGDNVYHFQSIRGKDGGAGSNCKHSGNVKASNGVSFTNEAFTFSSEGTEVGQSIKIIQTNSYRGTGRAAPEAPSGFDVSCGGGGGGASVFSHGADLYNSGIFYRLGLGGDGGSSYTSGGTDKTANSGSNGYGGAVFVQYNK